ncbi:hypothetical protein A6R71_10175 [Xanthomonas translucens pv. arrhenatheri]|nr:hypothetical protein A6R71_10175 [Xanthomonas translucens pv. arrhenatheri]
MTMNAWVFHLIYVEIPAVTLDDLIVARLWVLHEYRIQVFLELLVPISPRRFTGLIKYPKLC